MKTITCKICGTSERPERYVSSTCLRLTKDSLCFSCLHWLEQKTYDEKERGEHEWAVINGSHYVLCPHIEANWPRGLGGRKVTIRFNDGYETVCDNLWCQGEIPEGYWRTQFPDNAVFVGNDAAK